MAKLAIVAGLVAAGLAAGGAEAQLAQSDEAVEIRSLASELVQKECRGSWVGEVVATQGRARLTSDRLDVIGSRTSGGQTGACETERMIAEGRVLYTGVSVKIGADKGEYESASDTITFTGDVIMSSGDRGVVRGTKAVYHVAGETTKITSDGKPVHMIITPPKRDAG